MRIRILFLGGLAVLAAVALIGCSLGGERQARITATPTKTLMPLLTATVTPPPTATSLPPTETPLPPTATPVPPTITPIVVTATPSPTSPPVPDTPAPEAATETAVPSTATLAATPAPTQAPTKPRATNTPAPPTNTPKPAIDFRIAEIIAFVDGSMGSTGGHNINFTVVDAAGTPLDNIILEETNNTPPSQIISGDKGPGKAEFIMWAADYRFKIIGNTGGETHSSEETHVLSILEGHANWDDLIRGGVCGSVEECQAIGSMHYSYNVTFQRTW